MVVDEASAKWLEEWGLVVFGIVMGTVGALWLVFEEFRHRNSLVPRRRERLRRLLQQLVAAMEQEEAKAHLDHLRRECPNSFAFDSAKGEVLARFMGRVYHENGLDQHWMDSQLPQFLEDQDIAKLNERLGVLVTFGLLGPLALEKGRCVVVAGLEGEAGRLNSEKGVLKSYSEEKDTYEVTFLLQEVGSVNVNLPPSSLTLLSNEEVLESVQQQQLAVLQVPAIQAVIDKLRAECSSKSLFEHRREGLDTYVLKPIFERHGVDAKWYAYMNGGLGSLEPEFRERAEQVKDLLSYTHGDPQEHHSPTSEEVPGHEPVCRPPLEERARLRPLKQLWEVVAGGAEGLPVLVGSESQGWSELPTRLKAGAVVSELAIDGGYLHFSKLAGSGPNSGWVDLSADSKDALVKTSKKPLQVWVLCLGTRGDFQPYAALAQGLQRVGHAVRMLGPENQEGFSNACGLPFSPICSDVEWAIRSYMEQPDLNVNLLYRLMFEDFDHEVLMHEVEAAKPDVLIYSTLCKFWALNVERKFGIPAVNADLQPMGLEAVSPEYSEEAFVHGSRMGWEEQCRIEDAKVRPAYGVAAVTDMGFERYHKRSHQEGHLVGFLASLGDFLHSLPPHVREIQKRHTYTGFWFLDAEDNPDASEGTEHMEAVERFLSVGPAVYIGWGSCVCSKGPAHMVTVAVGALKQAGVRGIVLAGWAKLSLDLLLEAVGPEDPNGLRDYARDHVLFIERAARASRRCGIVGLAGASSGSQAEWRKVAQRLGPTVSHTWLFPKCLCHVHHGGVGTLAASWRTGRPVIVTPIWMDQFGNAELVKYMCGVATPPLDELSASDLSRHIKRAMTDLGVLGTASMLAQSVQQEDGVKKAIEFVEKLVKEELKSGRWHKRWKATGFGWRDDWGMRKYV